MKAVEIYTSPLCGYCHGAKRLLTQKGVTFTEIDVSRNADQREIMMKRAKGGRTVPQIFIADQHVGGYDDLYGLDQAGKLDAMLAG